jgi:uncharacterized protein (TIGR00730 family)
MTPEAHKNQDFLESDDARHLRILADYSYAESILEKENIQDTIVIFGSARIHPIATGKKKNLSKYYDETVAISKSLTEWSLSISTPGLQDRLLICTGGGPGIMEAGNKGAWLAGGKSIALNIKLPHEQYPNPFVLPGLTFTFHYFFIRKLWFMSLAQAVIVMPGGFGTIDELFETLTLIQTKRASKIPVVLYGSNFWNHVIHWQYLLDNELIEESDLELFYISDSVEDTIAYLKKTIDLSLTDNLNIKK